ncbi:MAG: preprotein translocase subunit YajC [Phycisphaerae bacterium]|nr:preprotein translocase subunit YajC [Phycisphaerae bacterium]
MHVYPVLAVTLAVIQDAGSPAVAPTSAPATPPRAVQVEGLPPQAGTNGAAPAAGSTAAPGTPLAPGAGAAKPQPQPDLLSMLWPMFAIIGVFLLISVMSGRKDKKRREDLMKAIGKGDKVQTIGGILGTVVELGDDDVLLRVDEASNTRIRFAKAAIQQVLKPSGGGSGTAAQAEPKPAPAKAGV